MQGGSLAYLHKEYQEDARNVRSSNGILRKQLPQKSSYSLGATPSQRYFYGRTMTCMANRMH